MAAAKPKKRSAREVYAALKAQHAETRCERLEKLFQMPVGETDQTFTHVTPTGMEWTLRRPQLHLFISAGLVPAELSMKAAVMAREGMTGESVLDKISSKELAQSIELNSAIVRFICVNPRIVEHAANDDEISFDDVERVDYDDLLAWATTGGGAADGLSNFRSK